MQEVRWQIQFKRKEKDPEPHNWMRWHEQYDGWFYDTSSDPTNEAVAKQVENLRLEWGDKYDFRVQREIRSFKKEVLVV